MARLRLTITRRSDMDGDAEWGYAEIGAGMSGVGLVTTEPALVDWLSTEAKRMFQSARLGSQRAYRKGMGV